jgi:hypothetical protein
MCRLAGIAFLHPNQQERNMDKQSLADITGAAAAPNDALGATALLVTTEPIVVNLRTACAMVSLSAPALRAEMAAGRLSAKTFGRKPLFEIEELRRYICALPSWEPK